MGETFEIHPAEPSAGPHPRPASPVDPQRVPVEVAPNEAVFGLEDDGGPASAHREAPRRPDDQSPGPAPQAHHLIRREPRHVHRAQRPHRVAVDPEAREPRVVHRGPAFAGDLTRRDERHRLQLGRRLQALELGPHETPQPVSVGHQQLAPHHATAEAGLQLRLTLEPPRTNLDPNPSRRDGDHPARLVGAEPLAKAHGEGCEAVLPRSDAHDRVVAEQPQRAVRRGEELPSGRVGQPGDCEGGEATLVIDELADALVVTHQDPALGARSDGPYGVLPQPIVRRPAPHCRPAEDPEHAVPRGADPQPPLCVDVQGRDDVAAETVGAPPPHPAPLPLAPVELPLVGDPERP